MPLRPVKLLLKNFHFSPDSEKGFQMALPQLPFGELAALLRPLYVFFRLNMTISGLFKLAKCRRILFKDAQKGE